MSITKGYFSSIGKTFSMMGENSRSVISTLASPCSNWNAIGFRIQPGVEGKKHGPDHRHAEMGLINSAGTLGAMSATVSLLAMPRLLSAEASRRQRA